MEKVKPVIKEDIDAYGYIGFKCMRKSGRKFKSGNKVNTIMSVYRIYHKNGNSELGFMFKEDDSVLPCTSVYICFQDKLTQELREGIREVAEFVVNDPRQAEYDYSLSLTHKEDFEDNCASIICSECFHHLGLDVSRNSVSQRTLDYLEKQIAWAVKELSPYAY